MVFPKCVGQSQLHKSPKGHSRDNRISRNLLTQFASWRGARAAQPKYAYKWTFWAGESGHPKKKVDIQGEKADIETFSANDFTALSGRTVLHIQVLFERYGYQGIFGHTDAMAMLNFKASGTSKFLSNLLKAGIIELVSGHGKGKYKFTER